jgi:uncharacterized protein DUF5647
MKKETTTKKNLDLLDEFMKYAYDHPDVLDQLPRETNLVILPDRDPSLEKENKKTLNRLKAKGEEVIAIRLRTTRRRVSKVG